MASFFYRVFLREPYTVCVSRRRILAGIDIIQGIFAHFNISFSAKYVLASIPRTGAVSKVSFGIGCMDRLREVRYRRERYISKTAYRCCDNIELSRADVTLGKMTVPEAISWRRSFQSSKRQLRNRTSLRSVNVHDTKRYVRIKDNFLFAKGRGARESKRMPKENVYHESSSFYSKAASIFRFP